MHLAFFVNYENKMCIKNPTNWLQIALENVPNTTITIKKNTRLGPYLKYRTQKSLKIKGYEPLGCPM